MKRLQKNMIFGLLFAVVSAPALATTVKVLRSEVSDQQRAFYDQMVKEYEHANPGVDINFEFLATEAFKQKLPTMLQSNERPDFFYSWGGGVMTGQAEAGFLKDITNEMKDGWANQYSVAGVNAFTVDGKIVGVPTSASDVGFWVNKSLAGKAGVDINAINTWEDFLAAVKKIKAAGINPIVLGGKDKWPVQLYLGYLLVRSAGEKGINDMFAEGGEGFHSADFIQAVNEFKRLVDLEPFQPGYANTDYGTASGMFGDGKAVFHLMGDWDYASAKQSSQSGEGIADKDMALMKFPVLQNGKGSRSDTFGGINGWVVAKGASKEAIEFLKWLNSPVNQAREAAEGFYIPVALGADSDISNPFFQQMSISLGVSKFHQIFLDQMLGADVGATFNDVAAELSQDDITADEAASVLQESWDFR